MTDHLEFIGIVVRHKELEERRKCSEPAHEGSGARKSLGVLRPQAWCRLTEKCEEEAVSFSLSWMSTNKRLSMRWCVLRRVSGRQQFGQENGMTIREKLGEDLCGELLRGQKSEGQQVQSSVKWKTLE